MPVIADSRPHSLPHHASKVLALLLCCLLVFSPWIFAPLTSAWSSGNAWAADINITGNETARQNTTSGSVIISNGGNLTVNGSAGEMQGGGISASGSVTISNATVNLSNNTVNGKGGGIYAADNVIITNATVNLSNNTVNGKGGGIYAVGYVIITGSNATFVNNTANDTGGAIHTNGNIIISGSTVVFDSSNSSSNGGGMRAEQNIYLTNSNATFSKSQGSGCAGFHAGDNVIVEGSNLLFNDNTANGSFGAGIHATNNMNFTNSNATFVNNKASTEGGGIYVQGNSTTTFSNASINFTNNSARTGGGLHASGGANIDTTNATFTRNNATSGGGLFANGTVTFTNAGVAFTSNTATTGGGFYVNTGSVTITNSNSTVTSNTATTGGGFYVGNGNVVITNTNATFSNNTATGSGGGFGVATGSVNINGSSAIEFANNTADKGGGFSVDNGTVTIAGTGAVAFRNNNATEGGGFWSSGTVNIAGSTAISANNATRGGGIYASNSSVGIAGSATVSGNTARLGGGIYANGAVNIAGSGSAAVANNTATDGGGIYATGVVTISGGSAQFTSNTATSNGGGIFASGTVHVTGSAVFTGNKAVLGGGIYTASGSGVDIAGDATFANNTATDGGGLYAVGDANITGTGGGRITFANNTAQKGGGLYSQGNVSIAGSGAVFANNTASQGGGIWAKDGVRLAPDAANTIAFDTARDNIHINSTTGTLTLDGTGVVSFNSTNNHVPGGVLIASGRTELRGAAVFDRTSLNMTGGTLYMGGGNFATWGNSASGLTVAARKIPFGTGNVGSGATASYATNLTRFHVGDNAVLALDMNHPGNANLPYFTLNNGTASTGSNTTLHGVIGSALTGNALDKFDHTYVIFTGSNGTIDDFTPSRYTTSHLLFNLGNPVYDATTGTFAVTLARGELPPLAPVPPPTEKDECPPPFPEKNLIKEVEQIIIHDYLYNGADQQGTLVGQNPFLDALFYVKPDGDPLLNCEQRFKSLLSAVYMGVFTGAREIMSETGTRLRTMLFSPNGTRENQGMRATFGFMPQSSVRWGEDNQRAGLSPLTSLESGGIGGSGATASARTPENRGALWVLPYYNYETVHGARLYDTLQGGYDMHLYGAAVGSDVTFGDGKYVLGGLFTTGRANLETTGDLLSNTNDADFVGGMVSFRWRPTEGSELGVYGGLLHQRNDVKQNNIVHMTTRFDSTLYQAGLNGHYERLVGNKKRLLTMDVGADVQHFQQDSLTIQAAGLHVGRMNSTNATTLLFPLTLGLREEFDLKNGSRLTLGGRVGYRLAAGDRVLKGKWGVPGGSYSATVHDTETDRHTGTAGVGLKWEHDQLSLTLDYDLELSKRLRNHMLMGQILWEF